MQTFTEIRVIFQPKTKKVVLQNKLLHDGRQLKTIFK